MFCFFLCFGKGQLIHMFFYFFFNVCLFDGLFLKNENLTERPYLRYSRDCFRRKCWLLSWSKLPKLDKKPQLPDQTQLWVCCNMVVLVLWVLCFFEGGGSENPIDWSSCPPEVLNITCSIVAGESGEYLGGKGFTLFFNRPSECP